MVDHYSDEQQRVLVNLHNRYDAWMDVERKLSRLPYGMKWKTISGSDYLYEVHDRIGNGKSLGSRSERTEGLFDAYRQEKAALAAASNDIADQVAETARLYRALRLPLIPSNAAAILREADRRELLGQHLLVIGTHAMPIYSIEAAGRIDTPDETEDFDFARNSREALEGKPVWDMLKAVDSTYTVNTERTFQARNSKAHEVDFLVAPSIASNIPKNDGPTAFELPEQEWLLNGQTVEHVVVARDGSPARIVAPDPRWFALQKLWLSHQEKRNPLKRSKDLKQGMALLDAVSSEMPQYPLDDAFVESLPPELLPEMEKWRSATTSQIARRAW